jgi:Subtilase family
MYCRSMIAKQFIPSTAVEIPGVLLPVRTDRAVTYFILSLRWLEHRATLIIYALPSGALPSGTLYGVGSLPTVGTMRVVTLLSFIQTAAAIVARPPPPTNNEIPNTFFVQFKGDTPKDVREIHLNYIRRQERKYSAVNLRHVFSLGLHGYSARLDEGTLDHIRQKEEVLSIDNVGLSEQQQETTVGEDAIEAVSRITFDMTQSPIENSRLSTVSNRGWNANRISHRNYTPGYVAGPWVHDQYLGQGINIYVLDTGLNLRQPGFKGSEVTFGKNLVHWRFGPKLSDDDLHGHGTMCAGVIAGSKHGLSPKAHTIAVKIADDQNRSACDDVVAGIEWVLEQPGNNNLKVISMSHYGFTGKPDVATAVSATVERGVHFVVCAGNDGRDSCRVQPSSARGVIAVGSINGMNKLPVKGTVDNGGREMESTNIGRCVTVFAPGTRVPTLSTKNLDPNYRYFSWGTSIAAPQVAAIVANRLSAVGAQTPAQMKAWLQETATRGQIDGDLNGAPNLILFNGAGVEILKQTKVSGLDW